MKLAIMQPYFLPYIGYWQLMNAVDKYVVYDDVNFIKGGWINRNRIIVNGEPSFLNLPMIGASSFKHINEIQVNTNSKVIEKTVRSVEFAYKNAPYFDEVFPMIEKIYHCGDDNLASIILYSFYVIKEYLGINTELFLSSQLEKDNTLQAQDKVIEICRVMRADEYYNAIGGRDLYSFEDFSERGIKLSFLKTGEITYRQFNDSFIPNLSILDVMMFNSTDDVKKMLNKYTLVCGEN